VTDELVSIDEAHQLLKIAKKGLAKGGGAGGASILGRDGGLAVKKSKVPDCSTGTILNSLNRRYVPVKFGYNLSVRMSGIIIGLRRDRLDLEACIVNMPQYGTFWHCFDVWKGVSRSHYQFYKLNRFPVPSTDSLPFANGRLKLLHRHGDNQIVFFLR